MLCTKYLENQSQSLDPIDMLTTLFVCVTFTLYAPVGVCIPVSLP